MKEIRFRALGAKGLDKWRWYNKFPTSKPEKERLLAGRLKNHFAREMAEGRIVPASEGRRGRDTTGTERLPGGWQLVPEERGPGPLLPGWEARFVDRRLVFIDHILKRVTDEDPRSRRPSPSPEFESDLDSDSDSDSNLESESDSEPEAEAGSDLDPDPELA